MARRRATLRSRALTLALPVGAWDAFVAEASACGRRGAVRTERQAMVDAAIAIAFDVDLERGWFRVGRRVVEPRAEPDGMRWCRAAEAWLCDVAAPCRRVLGARPVYVWRGPVWRWQVPGGVTLARARCELLAAVRLESVRAALEDRTGYPRLNTAEECADAARVLGRTSMGRFCVALARYAPR